MYVHILAPNNWKINGKIYDNIKNQKIFKGKLNKIYASSLYWKLQNISGKLKKMQIYGEI